MTDEADRLIQTRLPIKFYNALDRRAKAEGLSQAAFLRRMIMQAMSSAGPTLPAAEAWAVRRTDPTPRGSASWRLLQFEKMSPTARVFFIEHRGSDGSWLPQRKDDVLGTQWYQYQADYLFALDGGSLWRITNAIEFDRGEGKRLELTLEQEPLQ